MAGSITVRVRRGMSSRNGMWHDVRNGTIMRNTIYTGNKLTEERVLFSRQFYKSSSFFDAAHSVVMMLLDLLFSCLIFG